MIRNNRRNIYDLPQAAARIIKINGSSLGIVTYDEDNGYPQRMLTLINACSTAGQCVELLMDYIVGQGFDLARTDDGTPTNEFYKAIINDKGLTPDGLLRLSALDKSRYRGIAIHINYNGLYEIASVNHVPFETVRIGAGDHAGKYCLNPDWYNTDTLGRYRRVDQMTVIDKYDPDPLVIEEQVNAAGGWENYKGQILYWSEIPGTYPLSYIDSVLESVLAEIESDKTTKNNLKNNFQLKYIWAEKGQKEDDEEDAEVAKKIQNFIGSDGLPVAVVFSQDPDGKDVPTLTKIESSINDKLFAYTDEKTRAKIYRRFKQPAILHSDYMGTNGYNEGQLPQSMEYYNNTTHPERIFFEELFTKIFSNFHEDINPTKNYSIVPLANIKSATSNGNTTTNI